MISARKPPRHPLRRLFVALAAISCAVPIAGVRATPRGSQGPTALQLGNAPIRLEYPAEWREWAIRLAGYADAAARDLTELLGTDLPRGVVAWQPAAAGPGSGGDGVVEVTRAAGGGARVLVHTNVPLLTRDYGAAFALGYARWLGAYVVARVAMGAPGDGAPWWTEGAALYLTDRLFRGSRTTTPVLYGLQANFTRASQSGRPIDLAAAELAPAARGKAYVTFRLLEAMYGADAVAAAIGRLVQRPARELAAIADAIGRDRQPDPDTLLRDWLKPDIRIDVRLDKVKVRDSGRTLELHVERDTPIALPVSVQVRTAEGGELRRELPPGIGQARLEISLEQPPVAVVVDPDGLLPDVNRANNRHGFGDAARVRRFFAFDERFEIGELQLDGTITLDEAQQRQERFRVRVRNLTDAPTGLGLLVSAAWSSRPERAQRAYFVYLGPGESRLLEEYLAYPNRGTGRARIEARYWQAASPEELTRDLVAAEPGLINHYVVLRDAPDAPRRAQRGIYRVPPRVVETQGTTVSAATQQAGPAPPAGTTTAEHGEAASAPDAEAATAAGFAVRIVSPSANAPPIGAAVLEAEVRGGAGRSVERVDFTLNDRPLGSDSEPPYRVAFSFPDDEEVFVLRAVAVAPDRVAADDLVLDRGAVSFGTVVDLVTIHVTVRDAQGRLVRDLQPADFRVVEDGVEQQIEQFEFGEVPVAVALMLDQSSSMIGGGVRAERAGARRLIDSLVNDVNRAMVLGFNDHVDLYADFTNDVDELQAALETIDPDGPTALFDTLAQAIRKVDRRRGKRALVVLSDGLDTNSRFAFADVVEFLRQADVLVYTIGLQLMQEGSDLGDASGAVKQAVEQLRTLAEATGGAAYFPLSLEELGEIYGLIADELNSQYAISYYPKNRRFDGAWRNLRVEVPGRPGVWVQVRPGYYGVHPSRR